MASKKPTAAEKKAAAAAAETAKKSLLEAIQAATMSAAGMMYVSAEDSKELLDAGLVEINTAYTDAEGKIATRITPKGLEEMTKNTQTAAPETNNAAPQVNTSAAPAVVGGFKIVTGIAAPVAKRGATGGDKKYPFDAMPVGGSFFVPATADFDPIKKLGSTVSSANARYAVEIPGEQRKSRTGEMVAKTKLTRRYVMRKVEDGAPWGDEFKGMKGAGIFRLEDNA